MYKYFYLLVFVVFIGCGKQSTTIKPTPVPPVVVPTFFAKGADISWVTQMESSGSKFYDSTGTQVDCFQLMKNLGFNSIRLRAWVNPNDGWCNTADLLSKALRAKALGLKIMIDFHYSDIWADPGHQTVPAAWTGMSITSLDSAVYSYTQSVLKTLEQNNVSPSWVQVGNETDDGMLWEAGRASTNMSNFASLIASGYNAVKSVDTTIKVIVHISNGADNTHFRWVFDGLLANKAHWDIIGMSLYPPVSDWAYQNALCLQNINDMISRYGKPVMICEVGMDVNSPAACYSFLTDLISKVKTVSNNNGLGVFYWEPECNSYWNNYSLGAFDNTGKPTIALKAFAN